MGLIALNKKAYGQRAKQFTSQECFGEMATVDVVDQDRYGRTVGRVILPDGKILNQELVKTGLAWWYRQYAKKDSVLERLEIEARDAKLGLWADTRAVAPWEFRRRSPHQ